MGILKVLHWDNIVVKFPSFLTMSANDRTVEQVSDSSVVDLNCQTRLRLEIGIS